MYERARVNLISEISPALKVSAEDAEIYLDEALAKRCAQGARRRPRQPPRSDLPACGPCQTRAMSNVAFIGLGVMGAPMAGHLASAGHDGDRLQPDRVESAGLGRHSRSSGRADSG